MFKCDVYSLGKIFLELIYRKKNEKGEILKFNDDEDIDFLKLN
jgi:hypothetical protein